MDHIQLNQLVSQCCVRGGLSRAVERLTSSNEMLNRFLNGGLLVGEMSEWGMPWGRMGREVIVTFLNKDRWSLWIYSKNNLTVYPPAWEARGVDLSTMRFAHVSSRDVLDELKPVFLEPFFNIIILDSPDFLSGADLSFLSRRARINRQVIIVLRDFLLTTNYGNVWAKLRLNCIHDSFRNRFLITPLKGLSSKELSFSL